MAIQGVEVCTITQWEKFKIKYPLGLDLKVFTMVVDNSFYQNHKFMIILILGIPQQINGSITYDKLITWTLHQYIKT